MWNVCNQGGSPQTQGPRFLLSTGAEHAFWPQGKQEFSVNHVCNSLGTVSPFSYGTGEFSWNPCLRCQPRASLVSGPFWGQWSGMLLLAFHCTTCLIKNSKELRVSLVYSHQINDFVCYLHLCMFLNMESISVSKRLHIPSMNIGGSGGHPDNHRIGC